MNLVALAVHLETEGVATQGEDLFAYRMPSEAHSGILLLDGSDGVEIDENLPGYRKEVFRLIARQSGHLNCSALINEAVSALNIYNQTIGDMNVKRMRPMKDPVYFPISDGDFVEGFVPMWAAYSIISN